MGVRPPKKLATMVLYLALESTKMNFVFAVSTFTKGEQMLPVLNKFGTHCAVFGNHDFGKKSFTLH